MAAIDARLAATGTRLAREFPDYPGLASPKTISARSVQAQLHEDEALVLAFDADDRFKPTPVETLLWIITKTDVRWMRSELSTAALQHEVAALRSGLDAAAWRDKGEERCRGLLNSTFREAEDDKPFLPSAHAGIGQVVLRGGVAELADLRTLAALPETATEMCGVAADLDADPRDVRLGAWATEHEVKALSASDALAQARIVYFATHGALAGQYAAKAEPRLVLTTPDTASADDGGYLSASEIATLKLDADWAILSACNTAAGGANGAEAPRASPAPYSMPDLGCSSSRSGRSTRTPPRP